MDVTFYDRISISPTKKWGSSAFGNSIHLCISNRNIKSSLVADCFRSYFFWLTVHFNESTEALNWSPRARDIWQKWSQGQGTITLGNKNIFLILIGTRDQSSKVPGKYLTGTKDRVIRFWERVWESLGEFWTVWECLEKFWGAWGEFGSFS